jgi:APA family basic amino acid/polyamine antiporter
VPIASIITSGWLMAAFPTTTWLRFVIWLVVGLVLYFCYGYWRSRLHNRERRMPRASV